MKYSKTVNLHVLILFKCVIVRNIHVVCYKHKQILGGDLAAEIQSGNKAFLWYNKCMFMCACLCVQTKVYITVTCLGSVVFTKCVVLHLFNNTYNILTCFSFSLDCS